MYDISLLTGFNIKHLASFVVALSKYEFLGPATFAHCVAVVRLVSLAFF